MTYDIELIPFGMAFINGQRVVFNAYHFKKGKKKGKVQCLYKKGSKLKKIILDESDITPLEEKEEA